MSKTFIRYKADSRELVKRLVMQHNDSYGTSFGEAELDDSLNRAVQHFVNDPKAKDYGTAGFHVYKDTEYTQDGDLYIILHFVLDCSILVDGETVDIPCGY